MDGLINGCVAADLAAENMGRRFLLRRFLSQTPTQRTLVQEFAQPGRRTQGKRLWKSLVIIRKLLISPNPPPKVHMRINEPVTQQNYAFLPGQTLVNW